MANEWGRGTTPTIEITVPIDLRDDNVYLTFIQDEIVVLELNETEFTVEEDSISVPLTQENTFRMKVGPIKMQIRYVAPDGSSDVSNVMETEIVRVYKNGVLSYVQRSN